MPPTTVTAATAASSGAIVATSEPAPVSSEVGGVRASWWNAVVSLLVSVFAAHVPVLVLLVSGPASVDGAVTPGGPRLVLVGIVGALSLAAQLAMIPWLRSGLGGGIASLPVVVTAIASGAVVCMALIPLPGGALPLVSALSVVACASTAMVRRAVFLAAVVVAVVAWTVADGEHIAPAILVITLAYPYIVFASVWAWDVVTRLDTARAAEADLAVTRERLRFASDLHDIQGHSLQVIALKAELAERLLKAKPDDAAVQLSEVRTEAAEALARTRELARGYRATSIETELDNARDVLTVAGFECTTEVTVLPRDGAVRSLFGRALREATTNVLRHAEGGPVHIGVGHGVQQGGADDEWWLRVVNHVTLPYLAAGGDVPDGAGLAGLAERADQLGGRVTAGVQDDADSTRFVLTVAVPAGGAMGETS